MVQITVETARCIGAGQCVLSAPKVFDQDLHGIVTLLDPEPPEAVLDDVYQARLVCPSQSITITET